jgi:hypothetical protein
MKKQTKFILEKTAIDGNGGIKLGTVAMKELRGFRCPDGDGIALQDALELLQTGEKLVIEFPFIVQTNAKNSTGKEPTK